MANSSRIEWTEATWNPVAGCAILSPGCTNCYAMRMAHRLSNMGQDKYATTTRLSGGRPKWTGKIILDEKSLSIPLGWKVGRLIFVNSMSDLFHEDVPLQFINRVLDVIRSTPQHTYQILTKRAERLIALDDTITWPDNVWMGVSIESEEYWYRADWLRNSSSRIKFLSLEPLIGELTTLDFGGIDWVIVGGESGPNARPIDGRWVRDIRDACVQQKVPFHFKQWGGTNKKRSGRILDNRTWDQMPRSADYILAPH